MLLVYLVQPEPGCEDGLRQALHALPAPVRLQESGRQWLLRIEAGELESVREAIVGLKQRFPCLATLRPFA